MGKVLGGASLPFIACIALLVSAVLQILAFASPYWAYDGTTYLGLWRYGHCRKAVDIECFKHDLVQFSVPEWLNIVRGFECAGIVLVSIPLIVLPVYMYIALGLNFVRTMISMFIMALLAAICMVVGVAVFAIYSGKNNYTIQWCLIVCVIAAICAFIGSFILVAAAIGKRPKDLKQTYYPSTIFVDANKPKVYMVQTYDH